MMTKPIKYKETGLEWCPQIPEHWELKKLKYISSIFNGATPQTSNDEYWEDGDICWITPVDISKKIYLLDSKRRITESGYLSCGTNLVPKGSIVLTTRAPIGNVGIAGVDLCTNQGCKSITLDNKTNNIFIFYYLRVNTLLLNSIGQGTTFIELSSESLANLAIPLPPLEEQEKIANYLDRKTSLIDSIISKKEKQIELYKEERIAVINQAVTKGLNPDVEMKDSGIEWLGSIPKHWEVKKLKYCAKIKTGRTPKIQGSNIDFFENGTFNWFTPSDFRENILLSSGRKINNLAVDNLEVDIYPPKSIYLIGIGATVGKISYSETTASCNQQINVIVFTDKIIPKFGYYYLLGQKDQILSLVDYTTLPILNQSKSKEIDFIYLDDCKEQQEIVTYLDSETNRIDTLVSKTSKQIELLKEYKEALINEVVTGQRIIH